MYVGLAMLYKTTKNVINIYSDFILFYINAFTNVFHLRCAYITTQSVTNDSQTDALIRCDAVFAHDSTHRCRPSINTVYK